jgi:hypothetical protein
MMTRSRLVLFALAVSLAFAGASPETARAQGVDPDADYDRLDGTGYSGKTVNVIEWEGNLEIHVTPAGSLAGLALKLDKRNKDKPVMVIGYRFDLDPSRQLVRRAILGIELREGFKVYRDRTALDYDKVVITNNTLSSKDLAVFRLDPDPAQLYPEGHPALAKVSEGKGSGERKVAQRKVATAVEAKRKKAEEAGEEPVDTHSSLAPGPATQGSDASAAEDAEAAARARLQQDGTITPFFARPTTEARGRESGARKLRKQGSPTGERADE